MKCLDIDVSNNFIDAINKQKMAVAHCVVRTISYFPDKHIFFPCYIVSPISTLSPHESFVCLHIFLFSFSLSSTDSCAMQRTMIQPSILNIVAPSQWRVKLNRWKCGFWIGQKATDIEFHSLKNSKLNPTQLTVELGFILQKKKTNKNTLHNIELEVYSCIMMSPFASYSTCVYLFAI